MSLVAWWKLDILSGGEFVDYGPNKISTTNNGVSVNNAGITGPCGEFVNSSNDYINIGNAASYISGGSFSVFAWIKADAPSSFSSIVSFNSTASGSNRMLMLNNGDGYLLLYINGAAKTAGAVDITDGDWHHVGYVVDLDDGDTRQYVDGVLDKTHSSDIPSMLSTDNGAIGAEYDTASAGSPGNWWDGYINDVRIYDHALSVKEIKVLAQCKLVHFRFSEDRGNSGLIVTDSSGYGNHADAWTSDIATWGNTTPGQGVGYYTFDSTDRIPLTPNFDNRAAADTAWTCAAWVKMTDAGSSQMLINGLHNNIYLQYSTTNKARIYLDASPSHYCDSTDLTTTLYDNAWHQIVFVFDNRVGTVKIYVDAVDKSDTSVGSSNIDTNLTTWEIGDTSQCSIADFRFYNTPLSSTEVSELYDSSLKIDSKGNFWC